MVAETAPGPVLLARVTDPSASQKRSFLKLLRNPERRTRIDACLVRFGLVARHTLGQCQDQLCHVCLSYDWLDLCRWHGWAHSKDLGGAVKSFLSPLRYDYRLTHYLLSFILGSVYLPSSHLYNAGRFRYSEGAGLLIWQHILPYPVTSNLPCQGHGHLSLTRPLCMHNNRPCTGAHIYPIT